MTLQDFTLLFFFIYVRIPISGAICRHPTVKERNLIKNTHNGVNSVATGSIQRWWNVSKNIYPCTAFKYTL